MAALDHYVTAALEYCVMAGLEYCVMAGLGPAIHDFAAADTKKTMKSPFL